jgi:hypothetical protein
MLGAIFTGASTSSSSRRPGGSGRLQKKLPIRQTELAQQYPEATIEVWSFDEHRLGLKPIIRKVWAPVGQRPIAPVEPRYEWTYLDGFVHPRTGQTEWMMLPRVNSAWFNQALANFAQEVGAGPHKQILLVVDGAGWHGSHTVVVPEGIHLEVLPPYSPELQPAERLWRLADEPLANRCFDSLDELEAILGDRCRTLLTMQDDIKALTDYHWWPF